MPVPPREPVRFEADPPGQWRRVHPFTPFVRSWLAFVAVIGGLITFGFNTLVDIVTGVGEGEVFEFIGSFPLWPLVLIGALLLVLLVVGLGSWLLWRSMGYRVDAESVSLRKGLLNRSHRTARLDRVQSIDIAQPLLARLLNLSSLTFDVAGGDDSEIAIEFLAKDEALRLRDQLLARVRELRSQREAARQGGPGAHGLQGQHSPQGSGTSEAPGAGDLGVPGVPASAGSSSAHPDGPGPSGPGNAATAGAPAGMPAQSSPEHRALSQLRTAAGAGIDDLSASFNQLLKGYQARRELGHDGRLLYVPTGRVLASTLWRGDTLILTAAAVAVVPVVTVLAGPVAIPALLGILGGLAAAWGRFTELANFSVQLTPDGVLVSRGLTSTRRTIVPLERLQAIGISQPLLWRATGWWEVRFNIAGTKTSEVSGASSVILPVGSREDVLALMALALPDPGTERGAELLDAANTSPGPDDWFAPVPESARWVNPVQRRRMGVAVTGTVLVWREGRIGRRSVWVPHPRVQSMAFTQGPLQRVLGLANVHLHSTTGPLKPVARNLDVRAAAALFAQHAERTRLARKEMDR
ncbi:PH domain-containing protein [Sediminivirga luteola]|uniref:PH domain-containing protein n=1 Tax=Sediminivirga luteola TaxID=1774748 RepID=UPI001F59C3B2|nr:PH domain-containing protein [Sediminivirga luteola]